MVRPRKKSGAKIAIILLVVLFLIIVGIGYYIKNIEALIQGLKPIKLTQAISGDPINFLVLGTDKREEERGLSDTIIFMRLDPQKKRVTLVSIPRDSRVWVPGSGMDKINAAYSLDGAELTITTVETFLEVPINHYVAVDFNGFKRLVDAIGGIYIDVEEPILDPLAGPYIYQTGYQKLDGAHALAYVRTRNNPRGDFYRIEHQQKFFRALMDQSLKLRNVLKIPEVTKIFVENVETDLTMEEMLSLADVASSIKEENVEMVTIAGNSETIGGVSYVIVDEQKLGLIIKALKERASLEAALGGSEEVQVSPKDIRVEVLNGSGVQGIAHTVGDKLSSDGFEVVNVGNSNTDHAYTTIYYPVGKESRALKVKEYLGNYQIVSSDLPQFSSNIDVVVVLGDNYQ